MSKSSEDGTVKTQDAANGASKTEDEKAFEPPGSAKKVIRILTVAAYVFSVSFAAIMLSAYYVFLWEPPNPRTIQGSRLQSEPQAERLTGTSIGRKVTKSNDSTIDVVASIRLVPEREKYSRNDIAFESSAEPIGNLSETSQVVRIIEEITSVRPEVTFSYEADSRTESTAENYLQNWSMVYDQSEKISNETEKTERAKEGREGNRKGYADDHSGLPSMIYGAVNNQTARRSLSVGNDVDLSLEMENRTDQSGRLRSNHSAASRKFDNQSVLGFLGISEPVNARDANNSTTDDQSLFTTPQSTIPEIRSNANWNLDSLSTKQDLSRDQTIPSIPSSATIINDDDSSVATVHR